MLLAVKASDSRSLARRARVELCAIIVAREVLELESKWNCCPPRSWSSLAGRLLRSRAGALWNKIIRVTELVAIRNGSRKLRFTFNSGPAQQDDVYEDQFEGCAFEKT